MMHAKHKGESHHYEIIPVGIARLGCDWFSVLVCHIAVVSKKRIRSGFDRHVFHGTERGSILDALCGN